MSETILNHGYIPEEHAPDPVISHGDPTPPGKIGIWLFLASEIMFFIGVLGSYIVLRSGSPALFAKHAEALSKTLAGINTLVLILSSVTMYIAVDSAHSGRRGRTIAALLATILCGLTFMGIKYVEYEAKFTHHTLVARESPTGGPVYVYDGHVHAQGDERTLVGYRADTADIPGFNIHLVSEHDVKNASRQTEPREFAMPQVVAQDITYGPWKNIFYASYFTTTGVHGAHVVGGIIALSLLLAHALRGKVLPAHTEYVGLYWHFVDLVWIFLFPLLYLI
ncbi:cytochrome c oxidase subunit 3 [Fontivita pretiosa]|uniref:cytochrome c oxidase subunit 3 n=1 Tax=Fontivita pretiosa TaxID=2989684 RepID=UPI003D178C1D